MKVDWVEVELGKISSKIQYGYTESSSQEEIGPKFLRITDIQNNQVNWDEVPFCPISPSKLPDYLLEKDDLLFARTGATVGKSFLIRSTIPEAVFASYLIRVRVEKSVIDVVFLSYFFYSPFYWKQITEGQVGIGQPNVNGTKLKKLVTPLPPLPEQRSIVGKLEQLFSELDSGIGELQRAQAKLKVYRQAVLKKAFEGELTGHKPKDGELPKGWSVVRLAELMASVRNGHSKKPDDSGHHRILRISSVRPFALDLSDVRFLEEALEEKDEVVENDLLFTRYNGSRDYVGVCARVPALSEPLYYPDKLIRCRPLLEDAMHSKYLEYAANCGMSREFIRRRIRTTAGQSGISGSDVKNTPIPLCPIEEQHQIVQAIESRLSVCDKLEETLATNLQKAEALRQSILKKAFEGRLLSTAELEACRKEKDWCPAGELLERVKGNRD